jgi:putative ABC transport system permease protein
VSFLHWFCPDELVEGIYGDLLESFEEDKSHVNRKRASHRFVWNALRMCHPSIILRNKFQFNFISMGMLKSHLLVALRTMKKHKFYSAINMIGLSLAVGFVFLVFLFVQKELSYDQFHAKGDSVYRVYRRLINVETGDIVSESAITSIPLSRDLAESVPAVVAFTRFGSASATVTHADASFIETVSFADPGFLTMFDFPFIKGNRANALDQPNAVILSAGIAEKYFGHADPMNKLLTLEMQDSSADFIVTGVIDPKQDVSSLKFDLLIPTEQYAMGAPADIMDSYQNSSIESYILMPSDDNLSEMESTLTKAVQLHSPPNDFRMELGLHQLSKLHLESEVLGNTDYTNPRKVYILIGLALLVLLVAGINYVTLSIGHAMNRMSEVGVRKTLGAMRGQLRRQFMVESLLTTVVAALTGVFLARLVLPNFNELVNSDVQFSAGSAEVWFVISLIIVIGLISGFAQSIILVRQEVPNALKGKVLTFKKRDRFTNGLVVFQFALSIVLIIVALGMHTQMKYIQNTELGFDKERLLEISMNSSSDKEASGLLLQRFRSRAMENNRILSVGAAMNTFRSPWTSITIDQDDGTRENIFYNQVDTNYVSTMAIEMLVGSDFTRGQNGSANAIIVNEALVKHFGWDNPVGKELPGKNFEESPVVSGVFKDYHFSSLHTKIEPLILALDEMTISRGITGISTYVWPPNIYQLVVRFSPGDIESVIAHLSASWQSVNPGTEFIYHFVDETIEANYAEDKRWGRVTFLSSVFAIIIAWLGLLGLVRLAVERRTKEIGIRKVLGSTTEGVIALLSKQYVVMVLIGNLIAWPMAWWLLNEWLQSFNYRITLNPLLFVASGFAVFVVVLSSVSLQSLRAAMANPVEAMRTD